MYKNWVVANDHEIHDRVTRRDAFGARIGGTPNLIATVPLQPRPEDRDYFARLIAAAPAMLEALEYVVRYHREHDSGAGELFGLDYVTTCIAAIRTATHKE